MTKKDYVLITESIKDSGSYDNSGALIVDNQYLSIIASFAKRLSAENPRFDVIKFQNACGVFERPNGLNSFSFPCEKCGNIRDVEARICSKCHV